MARGWLASATLFRREVVRFLRQPSRVVGALATPLVFWFLIGSGVGRSFQGSDGTGMSYMQYFFPGALAMIVLFTAIFSTISIIEDRREGFLQAVLVSPAPRWALVLGKLAGGAALAAGQAALFLLLAPLAGLSPAPGGLLYAAAALLLMAFGLTGLGFLLAWRSDSVQGFQSIMNLFLFPMWFLSGALFPAAGAPPWMRAVMAANPLSYGVSALQKGLLGEGAASAGPGAAVCLAVIAAFAAAMFFLSVRTAGGRRAARA
ncbi:MAG: ABC transporter permease [Elusimicrobiota bacterium]